MEEYLSALNESQRAAVEYNDGPALVVAGAGSGKTRVLTYKIAYLLNLGLPPQSILALTFTNKAAREMKSRIAAIVGEQKARRLWMGTFHSIFSRILRAEADKLGYPSNFTIYDAADSKSLLKTIIKEMQLDDKVYKPATVQTRVSNAKNALITCTAYDRSKELIEADTQSRVPLIREIYARYQSRCFQAGAMDFDDLLLQTNILFRDHPDVLAKYQDFFRYVLVDEYQDTNFAQHLIVQRLCERHRRICVVGDDAQSIYSFRGANIDNILQFRNVYPGCRLFKLEQNYRSTQTIVDAANSLIDKNTRQIPKVVFSERERGDKIRVISAYSDYEEGYAVAGRIAGMLRGGMKARSYADFAILYRTNAQSRILEEALRKRGIPYKIYGGLSFFQRKEVKDVIAYFRLLVNPHDEEALKRVINYPARGIGETTVAKVAATASDRSVSLWEVLQDPIGHALPVNGGTAKKLSAFRELIERLSELATTLPADELAPVVVKETGLVKAIFEDSSVEGISRQENMQELLKSISEFCDLRREEGNGEVSLADFLSEVALLTDQDNDKEENADKVTMMTVHAAKGLEFRDVFIVGLEEDLFPSRMSKDSERAVEEERRLFYVALTRAEECCVLSYAKSRYRNGKTEICSPSRFLRDIDSCFLEIEAPLAGQPSGYQQPSSRPAFESPFTQPRAVWGEPAATRAARPSTVEPAPSRPARLSRIPSSAPSPSADAVNLPGGGRLRVGSKVRHERFGEGEVLAIEGTGGDTKAKVDFPNFGQKQLLLKFAKLTILD